MYLTGQRLICEAKIEFDSGEGKVIFEPYTKLTVETVAMEKDGELIIIFKEYPRYKLPLMKCFKPVNDLSDDQIKEQPNKRY